MRALLLSVAVAVGLAAAPAAPAAIEPVRWCGNDRAPTDRVRDRVGGPQIHVVYATPSDGEDRFETIASDLVTDVAAVDAWWRAQDPTRAPRFDLFEFPGCESRMGMLDLSHVRLAQPAAAFALTSNRFQNLSAALSRRPYDFANLAKKYLVFYDGVVAPDHVCGTASGAPMIGGQFSFAIVYLRSSCGATVGGGRGNAYVAAHELVHLLGAPAPEAPNACAGDDGHPCDSSLDVLWPYYALDDLGSALLDANRDDYYGHGGLWFDLQDSRWLLDAAAQFPLRIRVDGPGLVGSEPDGQGCNADCVTDWDAGTHVQLAVAARPGYGFAGWGGACGGGRDPSCLVELTGPAEVVAAFRRLRVLTVAISGRGTVAGAGLRCARACRLERIDGDRVALRARPARGWRFVRWRGSCSGSRATCSVRLDAARRVAAVFARR